jgi:hypothetical protein
VGVHETLPLIEFCKPIPEQKNRKLLPAFHQLCENEAGAEGDSGCHQRIALDSVLDIFDSLGATIAQLLDLVANFLKCGNRSILDHACSFAAGAGCVLHESNYVFFQSAEAVLERVQIV